MRVMLKPQDALLGLARLGARILPLQLADMALQRLSQGIIDAHPELVGRMGPHMSATFLIDPLDLPIQFCVRLDSQTPIICHRRPTSCAWDARIAGPIATLLAMIHSRFDGDALFFSRKITIEGDTDAILAMRNAIDAAEIDLPMELANLLLSANPAIRTAAKIAGPIASRLFGARGPHFGFHAT
jgi:predicted lipid carrier protein YhbT